MKYVSDVDCDFNFTTTTVHYQLAKISLQADKTLIIALQILKYHTVEPAISSHSYEQPTSYGRPLGHSTK